METALATFQIILALLGAGLVLWVRELRHAFWGFTLLLLAIGIAFFDLPNSLRLFFLLFICLSSASGWLYLKAQKAFPKEHLRPRDKRLGISNILLLTLSFYFLFNAMPIAPKEPWLNHTISHANAQSNFSTSLEILMLIFLFCLLCLFPLIRYKREDSAS